MTTLEAIVAGEVFDLSDRARRWHLGNDGWGLPPVDNYTERGPQQHGATFDRFLISPRPVQLDLLTDGDDEDDYWTTREELEYIFAPRDSGLTLRWTYPKGIRQLDCYYQGGLTLPSTERFGVTTQRSTVKLVANNPFFYDPEATSIPFGLSGGSGAFNVPLAIPWNIGSSVLDQTVSVAYAGTWDAYPIILIYGPITNPIITNLATGDLLDFTGHAVSVGDYYTIDTRYGYKRVYRNGSTSDNRINELTQASDLSTFRLARKPEAPGGINGIRVQGSGVTEATQVYLTYNTQYIGL